MLEGLRQSWAESGRRYLSAEQYQKHISGLSNEELVNYAQSYKRSSDQIWLARGIGAAMMAAPLLLKYMAHIDSEAYNAAVVVALFLGTMTNMISHPIKRSRDAGFNSVTEELRQRFVTNTQPEVSHAIEDTTPAHNNLFSSS